jgi:hypothetical protein
MHGSVARIFPLSRCWDSPDSFHQVQEAADASGVSVAAWGRHAMRPVTLEDFPRRWRDGETVPRSHDSPVSQRCFTLRLDEKTSRTLAALTQTFHRPAAEVIRQLIPQATPEAFPRCWHLAVEERQELAHQHMSARKNHRQRP